MKRHYFWLMSLLVIAVLAACNKKDDAPPFDPVKQAAIDEQLIQTYFQGNNITGTVKDDTSGLYFKVVDRGTTPSDTIQPTWRFNLSYKGMLLNGNTFDQGTRTTLNEARLNGNLIKGWKIGLRKIAKGDSVHLYIPSALAYGNYSPGAGIPANSVLVFHIRLHDCYF